MEERRDIYSSIRKPLGYTKVRGEALSEGEYYVAAEVCIITPDKKVLITKRSPYIKGANLWEFTQGGTRAGEETYETAIREAKEEIGLDISELPLNLIGTYHRKNYFIDVYTVKYDVNLASLKLDPREVSEARLVTKEELENIIARGETSYTFVERYAMYKSFYF